LFSIIKNGDCIEVAYNPDGFTQVLTEFVGKLRPDQMLAELTRYQVLTGYPSKFSS